MNRSFFYPVLQLHHYFTKKFGFFYKLIIYQLIIKKINYIKKINILKLEEELDDEKEEPDRLTLLLPQSKFDCVGKQTGYYADEDLNCEVFHYCQDNAKHSWICPEGFTFHQVIKIKLLCLFFSRGNQFFV